MLADAGVDAIYLPLPNSLHAEWAIKAAARGKHVLCEKPLALGRAEAQAMFEAARRHGWCCSRPIRTSSSRRRGRMLALLRDGAIGEVRSVQASFGFTMSNPPTTSG